MFAGDVDRAYVKQAERRWQDERGGALQLDAYGRDGTRAVLHTQFARIADALHLEPGMCVLDVGCGVGHFLAWLASRIPARYHGLDLSLNSLGRARQQGTGLVPVLGDAEALPYRTGIFDRVTCNGAAHHFLDEHTAFSEIHRVLAPGGLVVMYEPTATALTSVIRRVLLRDRAEEYESPADLAHKEEFTAPRAVALLREVGFSDIAISLHDFLAYPLSGNYVGSPLSRSRRVMELLSNWEKVVSRYARVKRLFELFAWRLLAVARKPSAQ